ncbi:MAG: menaquinone biosynthetic enzyme MqnA/MqnD family protein [Desulfovibrio sp.]
MAVRMGQIEYINVLPIYYPITEGIVPSNLETVKGTPAELNELMTAGDLDIASCSSIEYARNPDKYYLVPDLAIGSCGPVQSVILLSAKPIKELEGETILVSAQTHTSAALLKILMARKYKVNVSFHTGKATEILATGARPPAILAIGDEALRLRDHKDYPILLDMGEEWRQWTDLPFIFGVWIAQKSSVEKSPKDLRQAARALVSAKEWGKENIDSICQIAEKRCCQSKEQMKSYFDGLVYDLGEREKLGLMKFIEYLHEEGMIDQVAPLHFLD